MYALFAAVTVTLTFMGNGAFFSAQNGFATALDPQVFVQDAAAQAMTGPESISHDAGLRPAQLNDSPDSALFNAQGAPLGITLKQWLGATGSAEIAQLNPNAQNVTVHFEGLSPYGVYSVFASRGGQAATVYAPLDGVGTSNSFVADAGGSGGVSLLVSPPLDHGSTLILVFHSDGSPHGMSPGGIGVSAHTQLIVKVP